VKQEKQDRRSRRTRQLVTSALTELLQEKRYEEITVRDILERANIGSSTFYAHYFDKDDAQASLLNELFEQLLQQLLLRSGKQEMIPSMELFRHIQQNSQRLQGLIHGRSGDTFWKVVERTMSQMIEHSLTDVTGSFPFSRVPAPLVAHYLTATFLMLLKWWFAEEMSSSPEEMDEFFQQLTLPDRWKPVENTGEGT
jgi:AcrR family transcriptional regulator